MTRKGILLFITFSLSLFTSSAQRLLTLDSCRQMALRNNKQMSVAKVKQDVAENLRKSARTKYLPHVSAIGTYQYTSREISLLNDQQKSVLPHIGDAMVGGLESDLTKIVGGLPMENINLVLSSMGLKLEDLQNLGHAEMEKFSGQLNGIGQSLVDALETDTRHLFAGSIMVVQPVFLGGSIIALNKMADINEEMQDNSAEARRQTTLYNTDKVYWQVVSLKHKQRLAQSYLELLQKLWATGDIATVARGVLADEFIWGEDLNQIPGLTALLTTDLTMIHQAGMRAAIQNIL